MGEVVYAAIGRVYLWVRYRKKAKVKEILDNKFDGSYINAGAISTMKVIGIILITILFISLIILFIRIILNHLLQ
ncbi:hypothetical protein [Mesonia sp. K7]|uniref:hypothetical protein n=1 Tax=Mesonia sp. K7 TaxID=2218606 RepID=UPI000DA8E820|nr:hypothetical protein [Mesonia sp. K7]PZD79317.1 hypothetical protein DNG35_02190 [Mesonia sp. K7]